MIKSLRGAGSKMPPTRKVCRGVVLLLLSIPMMAEAPSLDRAFEAMYNLRFVEARAEIAAYRAWRREDPLAPVADASALLFSELARMNILQTEFFANDERFDSIQKLTPDQKVKVDFDQALTAGERLAKAALAKDPRDPDALFALSLLNGLRADYASLIEKRNFAALDYTKTATGYAEKVLAIAPHYYDAHLSTGLGKFLIGSKPAPVRWILRLGGFKGDIDDGMAELKIAAERGRYLAPFARLLLAVGYLRQQKPAEAHRLLARLQIEFPENRLFAEEAAKLAGKR